MADIKQVLDYLETEKDLSFEFVKNVFLKWYATFEEEEAEYKRANFTLTIWKKRNYKIAECEYNTKGLKSFTVYFNPKLQILKVKYYEGFIYRFVDDFFLNH